jgi:GNAT superfamily N-acetyltransferase
LGGDFITEKDNPKTLMNNIRIRKARIDELPTLLSFEQELIKTERPLDATLEPDEFHYYDLKGMIESDDAEVLVAELDNRLVGSGNARILTAKPYNTFKKYAFLGFMYVVPEMRGKSINQQIIAELVNWAKTKGLDEVRLQVYDENIRAVKAYEKVGFKKLRVEMRLETSAQDNL